MNRSIVHRHLVVIVLELLPDKDHRRPWRDRRPRDRDRVRRVRDLEQRLVRDQDLEVQGHRLQWVSKYQKYTTPFLECSVSKKVSCYPQHSHNLFFVSGSHETSCRIRCHFGVCNQVATYVVTCPCMWWQVHVQKYHRIEQHCWLSSTPKQRHAWTKLLNHSATRWFGTW